MPEFFIKQLAQGIKEKFHNESVEKEHRLYVDKTIRAHAPALFEQFAQVLGRYVDQLREDLGNGVLATDLSFQRTGSMISIDKPELPFVKFTARLELERHEIDMAYVTRSPKPSPQENPGLTDLVVSLNVGPQDSVSMQLPDGTAIYRVEKLAESIMQKLFTLKS